MQIIGEKFGGTENSLNTPGLRHNGVMAMI